MKICLNLCSLQEEIGVFDQHTANFIGQTLMLMAITKIFTTDTGSYIVILHLLDGSSLNYLDNLSGKFRMIIFSKDIEITLTVRSNSYTQ